MELGNHSEFLGYLGSMEMLCRWFVNDTSTATTRAQGERRITPADRREGIEFIVAVSGNWLKRIVIGAELVSRLTPWGLCRAAGARLL